MTTSPMLPSPALQAIDRDFLVDETTVVVGARQPGDTAAATRVMTRHDGAMVVLARMPQDPVASHLGVAADISVAQGIREGLGPGEAMLTLSLHVEQLSPALPGETLRGAGQLLSAGAHGIVARGILVGEDGRAVAEALGRFMAVGGKGGYSSTGEGSEQPWSEVAVPEDWARELPLEHLETTEQGARFSVLPTERTANSAGIMHGGIQKRLHEVAAGRVLSARARDQARGQGGGDGDDPATPPARQAVSIATTYHRPVPMAGPQLTVDVDVLKDGRRIAITQSRVSDPQGRLLGSCEIAWARG